MAKRKRLSVADFPEVANRATNEEEVKSRFCEAFGYELDSRYRMDLYTSSILFEFKYDRPFGKIKARATVIAQTMYYIRRLKYGQSTLEIPPFVCCVSKDSAFLFPTTAYKQIYTNDKYDWDRAPSCPDPVMVKAISGYKITAGTSVYRFCQPLEYEQFCGIISSPRQMPLLSAAELEKKTITADNFEQVYNLWQEKFGEYVQNGHRLADYFMADINPVTSVPREELSQVLFKLSDGTYQEKPMPIEDYRQFWGMFEKCREPRTLASLWQRLDRLRAEDKRRFNGEFYTPLEFASKAIEYLNRTVGERWWEHGYRLWDMAAGTGNLEYNLPTEALPYTYISTLEQDDADYCRQLFPTAHVFQYDYLNDDVERFFGFEQELAKNLPYKMPEALYNDLHNPKIKWVIFINPPFGTANQSKRSRDNYKNSIADTKIRQQMTDERLGEASRELFSQFLYRIHYEFKGKEAYLGLFSKLKYLNANNDQHLREHIFRYKLCRGFCFPSQVFVGNRGSFPVGFIVWNLSVSTDLNRQRVTLEVFNADTEKIGIKTIDCKPRDTFLNVWNRIPKVQNTIVMPPYDSSLQAVKYNPDKDIRDKVAPGFLGTLMCHGNDIQNVNYTALYSSSVASAGAMPVTPERFSRAMATIAVRRSVTPSWLNDRDQFLAPACELPEEFIVDATVFSFFHSCNCTASLKDVEYRGRTYQIINEFYPFLLSEVKEWPCSLSSVQQSLYAANSDRFGARWLSEHTLSAEAEEVLGIGKEIYRLFYERLSSLPWPKYKISMWDCGWYQIRMALQAKGLGSDLFGRLKESYSALEKKIRPLVFEYGFLEDSEKMFEEG